jgi:poly(3-hydroxyoctanoate) depolymerase
VLITGLGASLDLGAPFGRELAARGVQTVSFDAPGIGQSTPYAWPRRMPGIARTLERMLDALGYQRVDVLGASLGGVIAQQLAHQAPHRVRRLVLAATGPGLGGIPGSPRVLLSLATPRRYHQPGHYQRIAARVYGGAPPAARSATPPAVIPPRIASHSPAGHHAMHCLSPLDGKARW